MTGLVHGFGFSRSGDEYQSFRHQAPGVRRRIGVVGPASADPSVSEWVGSFLLPSANKREPPKKGASRFAPPTWF